MELKACAQAGSECKGDVLVEVAQADELTVKLIAKPIIVRQFGAQIEKIVRQAAAEEQVDAALIEVHDGGGALDFAIRARVRCALRRAKENTL